jgi:hypothetical protein
MHLLTRVYGNSSVKFGGKVAVRPIAATPLLGTSVSTDIQPIGMPKERERQQHSDHWEKDKSRLFINQANLPSIITDSTDPKELT